MWDKFLACKRLNIPYKIYEINPDIGGYFNYAQRYLHINKQNVDDNHVWLHELAHSLLHYQGTEHAQRVGTTQRAIAEIEAETTAFILDCILDNKPWRVSFNAYITQYLADLPLAMQRTVPVTLRYQEIKKVAVLILNAGGYYDK